MAVRPMLAALALLLCGAAAAQQPDPDWRGAFSLTAVERTLILRQMRDFLQGMQGMTEALARDDVKAFASKARSLGVRMQYDVLGVLRDKLPEDFRKRGYRMHVAFDELAAQAEKGADTKRALALFAEVQQQCVNCHGIFRIQEKP